MVATGPPESLGVDQGCLLELHDVLHDEVIVQVYQVEEVSTGQVLVRVGVRDRSDKMRSVMMRGRSPCLELRGSLCGIRGSDS